MPRNQRRSRCRDASGDRGPLRGGAHRRVELLQAVGITEDELDATKRWRAPAVLDLLRERDPLLRTDPTRPSILADPAVARRVEEGASRDGSSQAVMYGEKVGFVRLGSQPRVEATIDAGVAAAVRAAISRNLRRGKGFAVIGDERSRNAIVLFKPGDEVRWSVEDVDGTNALVIELSDALLDRVEAALVAPALLEWPELPDLKLRVLPPTD
jgi:hypothetical protein